jgi:hypothetical protein
MTAVADDGDGEENGQDDDDNKGTSNHKVLPMVVEPRSVVLCLAIGLCLNCEGRGWKDRLRFFCRRCRRRWVWSRSWRRARRRGRGGR